MSNLRVPLSELEHVGADADGVGDWYYYPKRNLYYCLNNETWTCVKAIFGHFIPDPARLKNAPSQQLRLLWGHSLKQRSRG